MSSYNAKNVTRKIEINAYDLAKESLRVLLEHGNVSPLAHLINELNSKSRSIKAKRATKVIKTLVASLPMVASTTKEFKDSGLPIHYKRIDKPEDVDETLNELPTFDEIFSSILYAEEDKKAKRVAAKAEAEAEPVTETETETLESEGTITFASRAVNLMDQLETLIFEGKDNLKSLSVKDRDALESLNAAFGAYIAFNNKLEQPLKKVA